MILSVCVEEETACVKYGSTEKSQKEIMAVHSESEENTDRQRVSEECVP